MKYLRWLCFVIGFGLMVCPIFYSATHSAATFTRMLVDYWMFYLPAIVFILGGLYFLRKEE